MKGPMQRPLLMVGRNEWTWPATPSSSPLAALSSSPTKGSRHRIIFTLQRAPIENSSNYGALSRVSSPDWQRHGYRTNERCTYRNNTSGAEGLSDVLCLRSIKASAGQLCAIDARELLLRDVQALIFATRRELFGSDSLRDSLRIVRLSFER